MRIRFWILVSVLLAVFLAVGCAPAKTPEAKAPAGYESLRIVGGSLGGRSTTSAMTFTAVFNRHYGDIEWSACTGAVATNPIFLTKGTIKLGIAHAASYITAYGLDKIAESRLRSISLDGPLSQYAFLIPEDKPWKDITEVPRGLTLCPGAPGSAPAIAAEAMLDLVGLSKKDFNWVPMGMSELADGWRAGKIDLVCFSGVMGSGIMDMWTSPRKFKLMGMTPEQAAKAKAERTFERLGFEAPSKSNLTEIYPEIFKYEVLCPKQPTFLLSRDDFPEDIAYKMARLIDERNAELVQIFPPMRYVTLQEYVKWARPPCDLHPGVAKYCKEKGYLK